jgi:Mn-containing catalase
MIQRLDQIAVDLPEPSGPNPAAAAAIQEPMGGKFGEMSTLMNYTFQSFNFRGKEKYRPFYDLICNIAAEEYSHIEAVAATINLLLNGAVPRADRNKPFGEDADSKKKKTANKKDFVDANPAPLSDPAITAFYRYHFANSGLRAWRDRPRDVELLREETRLASGGTARGAIHSPHSYPFIASL